MGFFYHAKKAVEESDIVVEVLDARFPDLMRNSQMEEIIYRKNKRLLFVLNKSDLISKSVAAKHKQSLSKIAPTIFVSAKQKKGIRRLKAAIRLLAKNRDEKTKSERRHVVAIIGYPNTGKSTILNVLSGRNSAKTSSQAGYTHGRQRVKMQDNLFLIDSPGVIPMEQRNETELALMAAKSPNQLTDCVGPALAILDYLQKQNPKSIEHNFGITETDSEKILDQIALQKKKLLKGGLPDIENTAKILILDWQSGKIRV